MSLVKFSWRSAEQFLREVAKRQTNDVYNHFLAEVIKDIRYRWQKINHQKCTTGTCGRFYEKIVAPTEFCYIKFSVYGKLANWDEMLLNSYTKRSLYWNSIWHLGKALATLSMQWLMWYDIRDSNSLEKVATRRQKRKETCRRRQWLKIPHLR